MSVAYLIQCNNTKEFYCGLGYRGNAQTTPVLFGADQYQTSQEAVDIINKNKEALCDFSVVARVTDVNIINIDTTKPLQDYQLRVILERNSLQKKIDSLVSFLNSNNSVCQKEIDRLDEQLKHMKDYCSVLGRRIESF